MSHACPTSARTSGASHSVACRAFEIHSATRRVRALLNSARVRARPRRPAVRAWLVRPTALNYHVITIGVCVAAVRVLRRRGTKMPPTEEVCNSH